jgi:hypothetical protein
MNETEDTKWVNPKPISEFWREHHREMLADYEDERRHEERVAKLRAAKAPKPDMTGSLFDGPVEPKRTPTADDALADYMATGEHDSDFWFPDEPTTFFHLEMQYREEERRWNRPRAVWLEERLAGYPQTELGRVELHCKRAADMGAESTLTLAQWERLKRAFRQCCAYCGYEPKRLVIEHVVPIWLGGGTTLWNVLPGCRDCNHQKGPRTLLVWFKFRPQLLDGFIERYQAAAKRLRRKSPA